MSPQRVMGGWIGFVPHGSGVLACLSLKILFKYEVCFHGNGCTADSSGTFTAQPREQHFGVAGSASWWEILPEEFKSSNNNSAGSVKPGKCVRSGFNSFEKSC